MLWRAVIWRAMAAEHWSNTLDVAYHHLLLCLHALCCVCNNALATVMSTAWMVVPRDMLYNSRTGTFFCSCLWYPNTLCTSCLCSLVQLNWCIHCHCRSSEAVRAVCTDWSLKWNCLVWLCENQPYQRAVVKVGDNVRLLLSWAR